MKVYQTLVGFVVLTTALPIYLHFAKHQVVSPLQCLLAFFLPLNSLICLWEISLGLNIDHINKHYKQLMEKYEKNRMTAITEFFNESISLSQMLSLKYWSRIWSTYSLYDPSYSNQESFGFFIDVGNGWSTIVPSLFFLISMTYDFGISYRLIGIMGILKFYQELYGTIIYFLSFMFNKRYKGKTAFEVMLFVGLSNGLWFFFPLAGIYGSYYMIQEDSNRIFLQPTL